LPAWHLNQNCLSLIGENVESESKERPILALFSRGSTMSFDEEHDETEADAGKHKTFFGLETGDGVVYAVVIILTLIFIRQVSVVIAALN
tara:strand:- start:837 stop:1106 length:270 start_codon:yes stop_codon:yes gene_type:complete